MAKPREQSGTVELDELDIDILRSLNENARKSFRDIAKELHVSLTTVSNRVKAMEKVFSKVLPVFTDNVAELSRVSDAMKRSAIASGQMQKKV